VAFPDTRDLYFISKEFLLTDLDLGLTFLDVAETSRDRETVRRNQRHAKRAYQTVLEFLEKLTLQESDRQMVESKLAVLRSRLESIRWD
jgi:hypothetical protein